MTAITEGRWGNGVDEEKAQARISGTRSTFWNEISLLDKVERMRDVVKGLQHTVDLLRHQNYELERMLKDHCHAEGQVMVSIADARTVLDIGPRPQNTRQNDEVYF